ncbi:hypothetical protein Back11_35280 [Paenibacillus baekrokdamisoli]|uniref:Uncharacterized protein n=1 Tax=Paenibacillus baekrokdamisoli TaxID=1712516 RepID=A0A3G9JB89_9BACL|nr:hypothetical protein [Paenibacillus baekrokdamisoli]MBB3070879.1 hypothetical protein [Paenibacillus baekrokdamisoli]BBH22183.1 hypothetical protein Back11_35280 [Paenibacillus baekrokdamisoli]
MKNRATYRTLLVFLSAAAIMAVSLTGCNYERKVQDSTFDYGSKQKGDPKMIGSRMYGTTSNVPGQHDNHWLEYSSLLSTDVSNINGVAAAIVMLTDKNAYVSISTDWTAAGTRKSGGRGTREQDNSGSTEGVYNVDNGSPYWNNQRIVGPYNSQLTINDHNQISSELKQTIAVHIRRLAPTVQEVHISANKEFANHIIQYAQEAWAGRSLTPWLNSFNTLVKHQFVGGNAVPELINVQKQRAKNERNQ